MTTAVVYHVPFWSLYPFGLHLLIWYTLKGHSTHFQFTSHTEYHSPCKNSCMKFSVTSGALSSLIKRLGAIPVFASLPYIFNRKPALQTGRTEFERVYQVGWV